jgi:hypothetical protein
VDISFLQALRLAAHVPFLTIDDLPPELSPILHFVFHDRRSHVQQVVSPAFSGPFLPPAEAQRLVATYRACIEELALLEARGGRGCMDRLADCTLVAERRSLFETVIAWRTERFDLLVALGPFIRNGRAVLVSKLLLQWIKHSGQDLVFTGTRDGTALF